jgi:DNA-directed RNA polymerase specialized sigma24 family protein
MAIGRRQVADLFRNESAPLRPLDEASACAADTAEWPPSTRNSAVLRHLNSELRALTPVQHQLLWYRIVGGLSWTELGGRLGIPRTAAKRRYQRLLRRLARTCGEFWCDSA